MLRSKKKVYNANIAEEMQIEAKELIKNTPMNIQLYDSSRDSLIVGLFLFVFMLTFSGRIMYNHGDIIDVYSQKVEGIYEKILTFNQEISNDSLKEGPVYIKMCGRVFLSGYKVSQYVDYETAITLISGNSSFIIKQKKGTVLLSGSFINFPNTTIFDGYMPSFDTAILSSTLKSDEPLRIKRFNYYIYHNSKKNSYIALSFQIFATLAIFVIICKMLYGLHKTKKKVSIDFFETVVMDFIYLIASIIELCNKCLPYETSQIFTLISTLYNRFMALFLISRVAIRNTISASILSLFFSFISCLSQIYDIGIASSYEYRQSIRIVLCSLSYVFVVIIFFVYVSSTSKRYAARIYVVTSLIYMSSSALCSFSFGSGNNLIIRENTYLIQRITGFAYCALLSELHELTFDNNVMKE